MQSVLGRSPLSYFQSLRVERAVHLLKTSSASVDEVAARVGYADGATLRALLRRRLNRRGQGDQANVLTGAPWHTPTAVWYGEPDAGRERGRPWRTVMA